MEWGTESSQMPRKFHLQKSMTKAVLIVLNDDKVVIHKKICV
jgi:hypothetical protein